MKKQPKDIFIEGPIAASFIAGQIAAHQSKTGIGGHSIFLGQVRADIVPGEETSVDQEGKAAPMAGKKVVAIEYTSYREMAIGAMDTIRETIIRKYELSCMHVYHSLGIVTAGEICLFVFTSSPHRKAAIEACTEAVEKIKAELPIWGKELFDDETHQWKINQPL